MELFKANRVTIMAEKLFQDGITKIIDAEGAAGYSVFQGGGKGQHHLHNPHGSPIVDDFAIVRVETIVTDRAVAEAIAEKVAAKYFAQHAGIVYIDTVEILRPQKFRKES